MSDLPFLPSDDEEEDDDNKVDDTTKTKLEINNKRRELECSNDDDDEVEDEDENDVDNNKKVATEDEDEEDDDDDDDDDDKDDDYYEMNDSFQFGGILGEDGIIGTSSLDLFSHSEQQGQQGGWSYQKLIDEQQQRDIDAQNPNAVLPRMNVRDIIDAKRKAILQKQKKKKIEEKTRSKTKKDNNDNNDEKMENDKNDDDDDDDDSKNNESESNDDDDDSDSSNDSSDDDDGEEEEKESHPQDDDVVRTRESKQRKGKAKNRIDETNNDNDKEVDDDNDRNDNNDDDNNDDDDDDDDDNNEDREEAVKAAAFFEQDDSDFVTASAAAGITTNGKIEMFSQLSISRPILRGIASMGFVTPTPIQSRVIPIALAGRDVCASAVTGSGKTAAFLIPILERLLHTSRGGSSSSNTSKSKGIGSSAIRAVILTPTRELAAQCISMLASLRQYIPDVRSCLIVGGTKNVQGQAAELRTRPDIVVATPGRLLDHLLNSTGCSLDDVEVLVLDEADRLLDLGFQEEVMEIIKSCSGGGGGSTSASNYHKRQTLLFSATMNTKVDDLIKLSLRRPVRVHVTGSTNDKSKIQSVKDNNNNSIEVAPRLEQEFIRVRSSYNDGIYREAILLALLTRTYTTQTIVFFDTKVTAHRLMIICGLCNIKCTELHGNLTQQQRLVALEEFRNGTADVLLATDLAARGLDIDRVKAVINFEMPLSVETYVHRIGRTARAGRGGRSCTLISEARRHLMKDIIKDANTTTTNGKTGQPVTTTTKVIRSRTVPASVIEHFADKIRSLEDNIEEVVQAEAVAKMDRVAEMEIMKAQNLIEYEDDIKSRPNREWFQSEYTKRMTKSEAAERVKAAAEKAGTGMHKMTRKKRRAREAMQALQESIRGDDNNDESNDNNGDLDDDGLTKKKRKKLIATTPVAIKAAAKQEKRNKQNESQREKSISDETYEREMKLLQKNKKKKKKVSENPIGDSSLFDDDKITYQTKKKSTIKSNKDDENDGDGTGTGIAKSAYNFRGFDPSKKLGKKKGHKAFKSKSKFKRRK